MKLPFQDADPSHRDFQYLEDLSTAYWHSEVFFAALHLRLFEFLGQGCSGLNALAQASFCREDELLRLLKALERLELVSQEKGMWFNSQVATLFLIPGSQSYMGDFFLYRRNLQPRWMELVRRVSVNGGDAVRHTSHDKDYEFRTFRYVQALDELARHKAEEIAAQLTLERWEPPILDVGGGAGALSRALVHAKEDGHATVFELPEVIAAAKSLYPQESDWERIRIIEGDFRTHEFSVESRFGLVVLSNFLHAYGAEEAWRLLGKSIDLLKTDGLLLVHDYFPDRLGRSFHKGPLYDLNMMLNTFDGECHDAFQVVGWLRDGGMGRVRVRDLYTDSSIILASREEAGREEPVDSEEWVYVALHEGFRRAVLVPATSIVTAAWARMKCACGCSIYGQNLQCPPHGMESPATKDLLRSYAWALILEGTPPGREFHEKLLRMEKRAFLAGFHKAFVLAAGPCPVCSKCPEDGLCRYPNQARPSMEGSGIDVYSTVRNAGLNLKPVTDKAHYVKYIGLLLLE
jgi:predicted metal-binding protein